MGRMDFYERHAYHVGKYSRSTPPLGHVIFIYLLFELLSDRSSCARVLACYFLFVFKYYYFLIYWQVFSGLCSDSIL